MRNTIIQLLTISATICLLTLPAPSGAQEQEQAPATQRRPTEIEEIVVTAQRREERLQDTPVSITAITGLDMEQQSVEDLWDIQYMSPNLEISRGSATGSTSTLAIRGIATGGFTPTEDNSVGVYIDGIWISRSVGQLFDMMDLERVEVLRGPQGTLFGKNNTGGALSLHTRKPDGTYNGYLGFGWGEHDRVESKGAIGFPILGETLSGRIAWTARQRDGWTKSVVTGNEFHGEKVFNFRGSLRYQTDRVDAVFTADRRKAHDEATGAKIEEYNFQQTFINLIGLIDTLNGRAPTDISQFLDNDKRNTHANASHPDSYQGITSGEKQDDDLWGFSLTVDVDFDRFTFRSISGHRRLRAARSADHDAIDWDLFASIDNFGNKGFQQEFQLLGTAWDDRVDWTAGLFMFYEESFNDAKSAVITDATTIDPFGPLFAPGSPLAFLQPTAIGMAAINGSEDSRRETRNYTWAPYLQFDIELTDRTTFTAGVRRTEERREAQFKNVTRLDGALAGIFPPSVFGAGALFTGDCTLGITALGPADTSTLAQNLVAGGPCTHVTVSLRDHFWAWKLGLKHRWSDDVMTFLNVSLGSRSGNHSARPTGHEQLIPTDAEQAIQYELGLKSQLFDDRVRLNAGIYHTNFSDIMAGTIQITPSGNTSSISQNIGRDYIQGAELEVTALPIDGLRLMTNLSIRNTQCVHSESMDAFLNSIDGCQADRGKTQWTYFFSARYELPPFDLGRFSGTLALQADYWARSRSGGSARTYSRITGLECTGMNPPCDAPGDKVRVQSHTRGVGSYGLFNAQITYELKEMPVEISLWGRNLADREYQTSFIDFPFGTLIAYYGSPRELGVNVTYRWE